MVMSSVIQISNGIGLNSLNCNNVNLDENKLDDCDPATVNHVKLLAWYNRFKQWKSCQKSKGLIPALVDLRRQER